MKSEYYKLFLTCLETLLPVKRPVDVLSCSLPHSILLDAQQGKHDGQSLEDAEPG